VISWTRSVIRITWAQKKSELTTLIPIIKSITSKVNQRTFNPRYYITITVYFSQKKKSQSITSTLSRNVRRKKKEPLVIVIFPQAQVPTDDKPLESSSPLLELSGAELLDGCQRRHLSFARVAAVIGVSVCPRLI
jgi:hypothetical protein